LRCFRLLTFFAAAFLALGRFGPGLVACFLVARFLDFVLATPRFAAFFATNLALDRAVPRFQVPCLLFAARCLR